MKPDTSRISYKEIHQLLQTEYQAMSHLRHILDRETTLLISGKKMEELSKLVSQKDLLIEELKALASQREQLASLPGDNPAIVDFESFLKDHEDSRALRSLWQQLLSLTATCQEINQMNGAIIKLNDQHMRQAIQLLRSESPVDLNYDEKGGTTAARQSRLLGQA
jgi:flagellar biosynthesis/type III secretory pathway chaperone